MFNPTLTARDITDWGALITLPKPLADAVAVYEESDYAMPPVAKFDTTGLTRETVAAAVEDYARTRAAAAVFEEAKQAARDQLATALIHTAADAVPDLLDQFRPEFDKATNSYVEAVEKLPARFTGDDIAAEPEGVQAAYRAAVEAAATIRKVDSWLGSLGDLPRHGSYNPDRECRVLAPKDRAELTALMTATTNPTLSTSEERLHGLYLVAARSGVAFEMHTPAEATAIRAAIDATPIIQQRKFATW
jgi:hypothetical protein